MIDYRLKLGNKNAIPFSLLRVVVSKSGGNLFPSSVDDEDGEFQFISGFSLPSPLDEKTTFVTAEEKRDWIIIHRRELAACFNKGDAEARVAFWDSTLWEREVLAMLLFLVKRRYSLKISAVEFSFSSRPVAFNNENFYEIRKDSDVT
ncbi:hypothetical protein TNCV_1758691 [Trichonephila clavipes]|nr:hypothetical protein TNCV_1758691 [Trichonephila clavipes]